MTNFGTLIKANVAGALGVQEEMHLTMVSVPESNFLSEKCKINPAPFELKFH
jgi:hypothetical protein